MPEVFSPKCDRCNRAAVHPEPKPDRTAGQACGDEPFGYEWLCADCTYLLERPDASRRPCSRSRLQSERLFELV